MSAKGFRQILEEKLAQQSEAVPRPQAPARETMDFELPHFSIPRTEQTARSHSYPRPARPARAPKPEPVVAEETFDITALSPVEYAALRILGLAGVTGSCSRKLLKQSYRSKVLSLHPDRHGEDLLPSERERRTREFQQVHEAYRILSCAFPRAG